MGQAPVPNQLKFDSPAGTGSCSGLASTDLSSVAAPNLHRVNAGADQLSGRDNRGPSATGIEWSSRERAGGTAARPLRGPKSPVREPPIHARGQQLQPQGMSPPKVQQPSGQTQAGNSVTNKFEELIISAQMQASRHGPSARGNCQ